MDEIYSGTLLASILSGSAALLAAMVPRGHRGGTEVRSRLVSWLSLVAVLALLISFAVHLLSGHTPGGPAALSPVPFVREHTSFVVAAGLPLVALLVNWGRTRSFGHRRSTRR